MKERLLIRRLEEEKAILKAEITAYKVQNQNLQKCSGRCLGEEDEFDCPLRGNCENYEEGTPESIEMFYTYAFGCDEYKPIKGKR